MQWLLFAAWVLLTAQTAQQPQPVPGIAGNWKGYSTATFGEQQTMLFIIRQDSLNLNGFSRCYLEPGNYAECRLTGRVDLGNSSLVLLEDSLMYEKHSSKNDPPPVLEAYRLTWNSTLDTLRGHVYKTVKGRIQKRPDRRMILWRVQKNSPQ